MADGEQADLDELLRARRASTDTPVNADDPVGPGVPWPRSGEA